jgi:hypothetical protein
MRAPQTLTRLTACEFGVFPYVRSHLYVPLSTTLHLDMISANLNELLKQTLKLRPPTTAGARLICALQSKADMFHKSWYVHESTIQFLRDCYPNTDQALKRMRYLTKNISTIKKLQINGVCVAELL